MERTTNNQLIITVDDDESVRLTLRLTLEMAGYAVLEAAEGNEALALLHAASELPALVLTDWNMPDGMGGAAFLDAVKHDPALAGIAVVVVSGTADRSALKAGASRVISKPFDLDTLLAAVESTCGAASAGLYRPQGRCSIDSSSPNPRLIGIP